MIETEINYIALSERTAEDKELASELLEMLVSDIDAYIDEFDSAIKNANYEQIATLSHKFKSALAVFGFDKLAKEVYAIEENSLKNIIEYDYLSKINCIFISLNNHIVELENFLKN